MAACSNMHIVTIGVHRQVWKLCVHIIDYLCNALQREIC